MGSNPDSMIKKAISEMIAEEMFKELGFYVLRTGQEDIVNPLTQLDWFIKKCGGKFILKKEKDREKVVDIDYLQKIPDFCIVDKEGFVSFLEVKFSRSGMLNENQIEVLRLYPLTNILVINLKVGDKLVFIKEGYDPLIETKEVPSFLKETRFHIWNLIGGDKEGNPKTNTITFKEWLKHSYDIEADDVIEKYEKLVSEWLH